MGWCFRIFLVLLSVVTAVFYSFWTKTYVTPEIDLDEFWGFGTKNNYIENKDTRCFQISYEDHQIVELKAKLSGNYTFTPALEDTDLHQYGIDSKRLEYLITYWRDSYLPKWKDRLVLLNSLPHFKTQIQGLNIHFIHVKPDFKKNKPVIPILLIHGWPGSVREFYELIPLLTNYNPELEFTFEIVAPSLPGFGWSDGTTKKGLSPTKMAVILRNLMLRLGHQKFIVQGGDWGSVVGSNVATLFPSNVLAYHSNMCVLPTTKSFLKIIIASVYPPAFISSEYENFSFPVGEKIETILKHTGYFYIQSTKPDLIGNALIGHPIGLAAYILEIFIKFIDVIGIDAIFDNLMIYYLNDIFTTSARIYSEAMSPVELSRRMNQVPTYVPTACARFYTDINHMIDWQLKDKYKNLIQSTYHHNGGHFAAFEVPDILYNDFVQFVKKLQINE